VEGHQEAEEDWVVDHRVAQEDCQVEEVADRQAEASV